MAYEQRPWSVRVRRTRMVAILEGLPYFGHIHAAVRSSPDLHYRFEAMFAEGDRRNPWSKMIPGGSVCVERLYDAGGWHDYITKRFATTDHSDNLIFLPPVNCLTPTRLVEGGADPARRDTNRITASRISPFPRAMPSYA